MPNPFVAQRITPRDIRERFFSENAGAATAVSKVTDAITAQGGKAYLVGGFVRDALLGVISNDIDLEVYGIDATALEVLLESLFPGHVHVVGKAFGILRIGQDGFTLDIALPRRESKQGSGHRGFVVEGDSTMSIEDASRRRDFTVNAMLIDLSTWELVDPFQGQRDLEAHMLRVVDPMTFPDDPLRVYRAIQLSARLGFSAEPATRELLASMVSRGEIEELSKERITDELKKLLLKAERPSIGFALMRELGIIERSYPELTALIGTEQEHDWHPEGDVWIHSLMVVDAAAQLIHHGDEAFSENEKLSIMLGALCHDLGKPATTEHVEGRVRSRGHEAAGVAPTTLLLSHWTFGHEVGYAAEIAAAEHLKPGMLCNDLEKGRITKEQYENAVRRLVMRISPVSWGVLLAISEADWRGRGLEGVATAPYEHGMLFRDAMTELEARSELRPLLEGRDLLALGLTPGPRIGELLKRVETERDQGRIKTREEAFEWVKANLHT
ncbi:MAG: hypothetical protein ABIO72_04130 [Patescibacteria group bacterium]